MNNNYIELDNLINDILDFKYQLLTHPIETVKPKSNDDKLRELHERLQRFEKILDIKNKKK